MTPYEPFHCLLTQSQLVKQSIMWVKWWNQCCAFRYSRFGVYRWIVLIWGKQSDWCCKTCSRSWLTHTHLQYPFSIFSLSCGMTLALARTAFLGIEKWSEGLICIITCSNPSSPGQDPDIPWMLPKILANATRTSTHPPIRQSVNGWLAHMWQATCPRNNF